MQVKALDVQLARNLNAGCPGWRDWNAGCPGVCLVQGNCNGLSLDEWQVGLSRASHPPGNMRKTTALLPRKICIQFQRVHGPLEPIYEFQVKNPSWWVTLKLFKSPQSFFLVQQKNTIIHLCHLLPVQEESSICKPGCKGAWKPGFFHPANIHGVSTIHLA